MKNWVKFLNEKNEVEKISYELDEEGFTLFFKKNKEYYGLNEPNRIVFAKIKTKDTADLAPKTNEVKFLARNLTQSKKEKDKKEVLFGIKDIPEIEVCEKEEVIKHLK